MNISISAIYDEMSAFQVLATCFTGYWVLVLIWIKGTDPFSSTLWVVLWWMIKIPLALAVGIVFFACV